MPCLYCHSVRGIEQKRHRVVIDDDDVVDINTAIDVLSNVLYVNAFVVRAVLAVESFFDDVLRVDAVDDFSGVFRDGRGEDVNMEQRGHF